jgi:hypothetical protein
MNTPAPAPAPAPSFTIIRVPAPVVVGSSRMLSLGSVMALIACSANAFAQASFPAVFVANSGNLKGSVTS